MMTHGKSKTPQGYKKQYTKIGFINMDEKATRRKNSRMTARRVKTPSVLLFFFLFCFFLFSVLLSKDIGYVIQLVSMLQLLRTQQKTPFRKTKRNQSNAL